jgi:hypothetical protein
MAAWGVLAGVAALITTAAFTDAAYLNLGTGADGSGIGGGGVDKIYNIQIGALNADGTFKNDGTWIEADDPAGVNVKLPGAESMFPGGPSSTVVIPVKNASPTLTSTLRIRLVNHDPAKTSMPYLNALRFTIAMPVTVQGSTAINLTDKTWTDLSAGLALNDLAPGGTSTVTLTVTLPNQATQAENDALNGKAAFLQAVFDGTSKA